MKPGVLTSELWVVVLSVVSAETNLLTSSSNVNYAGVAAAAVYAICRTALKIFGKPQAPSAATLTVAKRVLDAIPTPAPDPSPPTQG